MERCGISRTLRSPVFSDVFLFFLSSFGGKMKRHAPCPPPLSPSCLDPRVCIDTHRGGEKTAGGPPPFEYGALQAAETGKKKKEKRKMEQCSAFNGENIFAFSSPYHEYLTKFLHCNSYTGHRWYHHARSFAARYKKKIL